MTETKNYKPAGFWVRFIAKIIDAIIFGSLIFIVGALSAWGLSSVEDENLAILILLVPILGALILPALYEIYFYKKYQATLGKMALGIKVSDKDSDKLSSKPLYARVAIMTIIPLLLSMLVNPSVMILIESLFVIGEEEKKTLGFVIMIFVVIAFFYSLVFNLLNAFVVGLRGDKRGIHDLIAKTKVIKKV